MALVSPRPIVRSALRLLLDAQPGLRVVEELRDLDFPSRLVSDLAGGGVALIELEEGDRVIEALPAFLSRWDRMKVLVLAREDDRAAHVLMMQAGAMGVILKEKTADSLITAIRKVDAGEVWLERVMMARVLGELSLARNSIGAGAPPRRSDALSPREHEVVVLIAQGLRNKEIAARLFLSEATVRHHLTSIFSKLAVRDRCELVVFAFRHGLSIEGRPQATPAHIRPSS